MHTLLLVTDNNPSWISRWEENDCRNYFMINLHESMGPGRDLTRNPGSGVRHISAARQFTDCTAYIYVLCLWQRKSMSIWLTICWRTQFQRIKCFLQVKNSQINRGYLLFWCEYQIYFIECVENIRIFMSAQHEWKFRCFQLTRWNIRDLFNL